MAWTNSEMKKHNTLKAFRVLRAREAISRRELMRLSGLSWGTVSAVCADLLQKEIVVAQKDTSQGGRPPEQLIVNPKKNLVLAIDINSIGIAVNVVSLAGKPLYTANVAIQSAEKAALLGQLTSCVQSVLRNFPSVIAIGLSMQGKLSSIRGVSLRTNYFINWANINLVELFTQTFGLPTYLYHDPECLLTYHKNTDERLKDCDNGIAIRIDNGIGMALLQEGQVRQFRPESSFEIGHIISVPHGRLCACGKRGCLEAYASLRGMNERYETLENKSYPDFISALQNADSDAVAIYDEGVRNLGIALANLCALFEPSFILLDGYALSLMPDFFEDVRKQAEDFSETEVPLLKACFKREAPAIGAAYLTIDKIIGEVLFA